MADEIKPKTEAVKGFKPEPGHIYSQTEIDRLEAEAKKKSAKE